MFSLNKCILKTEDFIKNIVRIIIKKVLECIENMHIIVTLAYMET